MIISPHSGQGNFVDLVSLVIFVLQLIQSNSAIEHFFKKFYEVYEFKFFKCEEVFIKFPIVIL